MAGFLGVFPRTDGPGSGPEPATPTPGNLALVYRHRLDCLDTSPRVPVLREILDVSPVLVICEVDRDPIEPGGNDAWKQRADEAHASVFYDAPTKLDELLAWHRIRQAEGAAIFGSAPNLPALDDLDLSGLPAICERYRENYRAIFDTETPFVPACWSAFDGRGGWRDETGTVLGLALDDPASPLHTLERWYHHALTCLTIPVLEAAVA